MNKETIIQNKVIAGCADIAFLWRYQVGEFYTMNAQRITIGFEGAPDVWGFRKSDGKMIFLELKTMTGKLRPKQKEFKENVGDKFPVIYGVPRSLDEARRIINGNNNQQEEV